MQSTETTGMNDSGEVSTAGPDMNVPSDDYLVAPARRLQYGPPPSKHAKGRQTGLSKKEKARRKAKAIRDNRAVSADKRALERALNG